MEKYVEWLPLERKEDNIKTDSGTFCDCEVSETGPGSCLMDLGQT